MGSTTTNGDDRGPLFGFLILVEGGAWAGAFLTIRRFGFLALIRG